MKDFFFENSITRALDELFVAAKSGKYEFAPWMPLIGLPGSGKTASVQSWLKHNNIKNIYIDAPAHTLKKEEIEYLKIDSYKEPSVKPVSSSELTDLFSPVKKEISIIFSNDEIDQMDENTAIIIDNYDKAPAEVRKELFNLIRYHHVVDMRVDAPQKIKLVQPLLLVVIIDQANIMLSPLSREENRLFDIH